MTIELYIANQIKEELLTPLYHSGYKFDTSLEQIKRDVMAVYFNSTVNEKLQLNKDTVRYIDEYITIALKLFLEKVQYQKPIGIKGFSKLLHDYCYIWSIDKFSLLKELQNLGVSLLVNEQLLGVKQNTNPHKWLEKIEELGKNKRNFTKSNFG
jgi:hypothetical protein